ncbi:MAG: TIGR00282 family metallophosphoesterase [Pseudomonadota bacterium]
MKILAIGDIFGRPGRAAIKGLLPKLIKEHAVDFVIINGENAAGGKGLTPKIVEELFELPIDAITAGNHIWEHKQFYPYFDTHPILRPINIKETMPGRGWLIKQKKGLRIAVVSLQGQIYMDNKGPQVTNPFNYIEAILPTIQEQSDIIVIDFHAEATSEKRALAWFLDGQITALLGTHTHVQTADAEILPQGTAYISDLGMTGPHASVIGLDKDAAIARFLTGEKKTFKVADKGVRLEGAVIEVDEKTFKAKSIKRLQVPLQ